MVVGAFSKILVSAVLVRDLVVVVATVQVRLAGVESVLPEASVALTEKVWEPSAKPVYCCGEVQLLKAVLSRRHSKVEFASLEENSKVAEVLFTVAEGPEVMVVSGGVVSAGGAAAVAKDQLLSAPRGLPARSFSVLMNTAVSSASSWMKPPRHSIAPS